MGGHYIEFEINRDAIARYGLTVGDVQDVLSVALGGMSLTTTVEGLQRYTINLRYDRDFRSDLRIAATTTSSCPRRPARRFRSANSPRIKVVDGPMSIKTEGAVPNDWVYVDIRGVDVGTYVQMRHARRERSHRRRRKSNCRPATTFSGAANTNTCCAPSNAC